MTIPNNKRLAGVKRVVVGWGYVIKNPGHLSTEQFLTCKRTDAMMADIDFNAVGDKKIRLIAEILE